MARPRKFEQELYENGVLAQLAGVDVGYDGVEVLNGVFFEARMGEVALVAGPTSAGKTTLMHVLRLALPPRAGDAMIMGADVQHLNVAARSRIKRRIGYIAENPVFVEEWTGLANIEVALRVARKKGNDVASDVRELANFVGLGQAGDQPVRELSGAQRRRVAIARALAAKPELILADDPTAGMSPEAGRRIVRLLAEMRRVGAGVVITTQDESLLEWAPGATLWRLGNGKLTAVETEEAAEA